MTARAPEVSVVIGVRDAAAAACATLRSVLAQRDVDLECVVVDDGSRDATAARVGALARQDPRVRLLRQAPGGLTRALITGCAEARAPLIARIDAGDRMLDGRLARQRALLADEPGIDVLSSDVRLCGPRGELLAAAEEDASPQRLVDLTPGFRSATAAGLTGVAHMSVCFRRDAYRAAGGYRPAFRLAQDVDLWARMAECGRIVRLCCALTEARVRLDGLSPHHHRTQRRLRELAAGAARARRDGRDEVAILERAERVSRGALVHGGRRGAAAYFVASCLARNGALGAAQRYYALALRADPGNLRALLGCARTQIRRLARHGGGER